MLLYLSLLFGYSCAEEIIVTTEQGQVRVVQREDVSYSDYYSFYGIPYAGSVTGSNRFKAAPPPRPYSGVFNAVNNKVVCAHPTSEGISGTEDCLALNIYTKNITTPKPVMVILLGEDYSTIDPKPYSYEPLVDADVVVVTMNYRLSIFGFLCLGVPEAPGNAGLKDVIQGLRWIKKNIAGFGGDAKNVVLFGHGSGAAMVDLITLSPLGKGLVHKAITQSGSALAPWAVAYEPIKYAKAFAARLGYTEETPAQIASKLATVDSRKLVPALNSFIFQNNSVLFAPCIENKDLNDTFLTEAPIDLIKSGKYNHIPFIAGYTDKEGMIRAGEALYGGWLDKMDADFTNFIPVDLALPATADKSLLAQDIRKFYWKNKAVNMTTIKGYLDYYGDTIAVIPVIRGAKARAATSQASVFLLEFTYRGTKNSYWLYSQIPIDGVCHGGLLNYLFDFDLKEGGRDEMARSSIINRFTAFAYTGTPANERDYWLPITPSEFNYLHYGGDSETLLVTLREKLNIDPHFTSYYFWHKIYEKYYVCPKAYYNTTMFW